MTEDYLKEKEKSRAAARKGWETRRKKLKEDEEE